MAAQRSTKDRHSSSSASASALMNSSASALTKSVNGTVQSHHSNRSKPSTTTAKRSVTPNSRLYSNPNVNSSPSSSTSTSSSPTGLESDRSLPSKRPLTPVSKTNSTSSNDPEPGRVRVAVRLRPRNDEDRAFDADFADCVELQPELKKLNLKKNNWSSESYKFDEVFTETASQKRIYEVVAKPVVESVMSGYNGTIMAYGQTGTGKTHTVGNLGKNDASQRGIMVRALEDIITNTALALDTLEVSYLELYLESLQDLLAPEKINIPIVEDAKTGEVLLPGASMVKIHDLDHFMELLQSGEANRRAANTKLNTNSSRSHAILMVYVKRSVAGKLETGSIAQVDKTVKMIRKSKLLIVDLAGSERIDKSGSEGQLLEEAKFINLSLTSLGKCINALAENSPHIPTRESKLTRILRDSFGGSARTSLIITIGPSARHHAETTGTIMFGQRAMKVVNMMKMKEEFDYESLSRKLESQVDHLTKEIDRQQKLRDNYINEMEKKLRECQKSFADAEKSLVARSEFLEKDNARLEMEIKCMSDELSHQKDCNRLLYDEVARLENSIENFKKKEHEISTYQKSIEDTTQMYEKQIEVLIKQLEHERACSEGAERQMETLKDLLCEQENSLQQCQKESSKHLKDLLDSKQTQDQIVAELQKQLEDTRFRCEQFEHQVGSLKKLLKDQNSDQELLSETIELYEKKISDLNLQLQDEYDCRKQAEEQMQSLQMSLTEKNTSEELLSETIQRYEKKISDLNMQLQDECAYRKKAEEQMESLQKLLNEKNTSESTDQERLSETIQLYEKKISDLNLQLQDEYASRKHAEEQMESLQKLMTEKNTSGVNDLMMKLEEKDQSYQSTVEEMKHLKMEIANLLSDKESLCGELDALRNTLTAEGKEKMALENELLRIKKLGSENSEDNVDSKPRPKPHMSRESSSFRSALGLNRSMSGQRATIAKICEEVGLEKILKLLSSEDVEIQMHALKVVANLAAEDINQEKIVNEGGLDALLMLLQTSQNTTILRVASGAVANLAMNETNQGLIMSKGGAQLLADTASKTDDPQTLRMVAGAIANLCGNVTLHQALKQDGGIKALLGMSRSANADVIAQVARGLANFAKCETRDVIQGHRTGRSLLMEDGALSWLIVNSKTTYDSTRRHIELALCHLAQNDENASDFISNGGLRELTRISSESAREDIRNLARKTLKSNKMFQAQLRADG